MDKEELQWEHINPPELFEVTVRVKTQIKNLIAFESTHGPNGEFHMSDQKREELSQEYEGMNPREAEIKVYNWEVESWYISRTLTNVYEMRGLKEYSGLIKQYKEREWTSIDYLALTGLNVKFLKYTEDEGSYQPLKFYLETLVEIDREKEAQKVVKDIKWAKNQPDLEDILRDRVCPDCGKILQNWRGMRRHQGLKHKSIFDALLSE